MTEKPHFYDQEIKFSPFEICAYLQFQLDRLKKNETQQPHAIEYVKYHKKNWLRKKAQIRIGLREGFGVELIGTNGNPERPIIVSTKADTFDEDSSIEKDIEDAQRLVDAFYLMAFCTHGYPMFIREDGTTCASHYHLASGDVGCPTRDRSYRKQLKEALHKT